MGESRIEVFAQMAQAEPGNEMVWYGLANELVKAERWSEAADALRRVLSLNPDYTAAYQLLGTSLLRQGETAEARKVWRQGVEAADRTGAWKARQHMEGLLASAGAEPPADFCE